MKRGGWALAHTYRTSNDYTHVFGFFTLSKSSHIGRFCDTGKARENGQYSCTLDTGPRTRPSVSMLSNLHASRERLGPSPVVLPKIRRMAQCTVWPWLEWVTPQSAMPAVENARKSGSVLGKRGYEDRLAEVCERFRGKCDSAERTGQVRLC